MSLNQIKSCSERNQESRPQSPPWLLFYMAENTVGIVFQNIFKVWPLLISSTAATLAQTTVLLPRRLPWSSHWLGCFVCVPYTLLPAWQLEGFHQHLSIILPPSPLETPQTVLISLESKRQSSTRCGPFPPFPFPVWSHPLPLYRNSTSKSVCPFSGTFLQKHMPFLFLAMTHSQHVES